MGLKWILSITLCLIALTYSVPVEVIYAGDGCECPTKLAYQVNVPKLTKPRRYPPYDYGYKIDVPPIQAKAKVSYTFDFSVEEPRPPRPEKQDKLNLYAKVDRITMNKQDCPGEYGPPYSSCNCGQCGVSKPPYRYVNRKVIPCKCQRPKCLCNLRRRLLGEDTNSQAIVTRPFIVTSDPLERKGNSIRRKRDLHRIFFRPIRQENERMPRYVKLYHKSIPEQNEGLFNFDLLTNRNPFKRKTKKVYFPNLRSKIVKRDIKGEYDLLAKEHEVTDLTLPEIIQFLPETLQPNFKRGQCHFGCDKSNFQDLHIPEGKRNSRGDSQDNNESTKSYKSTTNISNMHNSDNENNNEKSVNNNNNNNNENSVNSYTKRNVDDNYYQNLLSSFQAAVSPITQANAASYIAQQNDYNADISQSSLALNPTNPINEATSPAMLSPCEQRKVYATLRRRAEAQSKYANERLDYGSYLEDNRQLGNPYLPIRPLSDIPQSRDAIPLQYAGDFEHGGYSEQYPNVGAKQYPVQHVSSELLDHIISDIIYRHPDFIDATSHYGGALVDPEPYQKQQTKDFIKKLLDGRFGVHLSEPDNSYTHYFPLSSYSRQIYNPFPPSRPLTYYSSMY